MQHSAFQACEMSGLVRIITYIKHPAIFMFLIFAFLIFAFQTFVHPFLDKKD